MGSLMAGWSSPFSDPEAVRLERNKSLTKEEIDSFWKGHKPNEDDLHTTLTSPTTPQALHETDPRLKRTFLGLPDAPDSDKPAKISDWWTRSNSAFLNEPPRDEVGDSAHKYTAQFHVAGIAIKKA